MTKEQRKEYDRLYYQKNQVKRDEQNKINRRKYAEYYRIQQRIYYKNNFYKKKIYYQNNREHILIRQKEWYHKNKVEINKKKRELYLLAHPKKVHQN